MDDKRTINKRKIKEWIDNPKTKRELDKIIKDAQEQAERIKQGSRVHPEKLKEPFNI